MTTDQEREYNTAYVRNRRIKRSDDLKVILGGQCTICDSKEDLEFDHIDNETKSFTIWENIDKPWNELLEEIKKCQLLCRSCHNRKTHGSSLGHGEDLTGKRGCKCEPCKARNREYMRNYYKTHPRFR